MVDPHYDPTGKRSRAAGDVLAALLVFVVLAVCLGGSCAKNYWTYQECQKVGHGDAYCAAQAAGCLDRGRRK